MTIQKDTKADLLTKLRRRNIVILRLCNVNRSLKEKIRTLEKKLEKQKRPPFYARIWAFIKKTIRVK